MRPLSRWGRVLVLLAALLFLAGTVYATTGTQRALSLPEQWLREGLAPFQAAASRVVTYVTDTTRRVRERNLIAEENDRLRQELAEVRVENARLRGLARENSSLREALAFQEGWGEPLLAARVVGRPPNNWLSTLTINVGSRDGVAEGAGVLSPEGIVGQVRSVSNSTANVMLLTDAMSAVGGEIRRSGALVLVEGGGTWDETLSVTPLDTSEELREGDVILTSNLSSVYPKGMPIGTIIDVVPDAYGFSVVGTLQPAAQLDGLDTLFLAVPSS